MNDLLSNILIQPKVVTKENCKYLIDYANRAEKEQMGVFDPDKTNLTKQQEHKVDKSSRDVKCADVTPILPQIQDLMKNTIDHIINPFYNFKIRDSEMPQLLYYEKGGHYKPHYDAEALWTNPDGTKMWKKSVDRDLSTVLFLNNDFEGGYFTFPDLRVTIKPEPGLLVCFPSSRWFKHCVEPVLSGQRYSLVTWMRVQGFQTKEEQDKEIEKKYGIKVP
jgi:predicted 2-oxoglutarate/Fe(II)-dependent dioxygenase YbiX